MSFHSCLVFTLLYLSFFGCLYIRGDIGEHGFITKTYLSWRDEGAVCHLGVLYQVALLAGASGAFKEDHIVEQSSKLL